MGSPGKNRGRAASRPSRLAMLMIASLGSSQALAESSSSGTALFANAQTAKMAADDPSMTEQSLPPVPLAAPENPASVQHLETQNEEKSEAAAEPPAPPLTPLQALIEERAGRPLSGLHIGELRREREAIAGFYAARDFALLWFKDGKPSQAARSLLPRLAAAADDGLDLGPRLPSLPAEETVLDEAQMAALDLALSDAIIAYGRQASGARVDPHDIGRLIGTRPEVADPSFILASVATAGQAAGSILRGFNPAHEGYIALRDRLASARRNQPPLARRTIPSGPVLRVGMRDPRVALIRARLSLDGEFERGTSARERRKNSEALVYDTEVAMAVADFQRANGLPASGTLTPQTSAMLLKPHVSASDSLSSGPLSPHAERQILANMEIWRWMPRDLGHDRIEVNLPDFEVTVIEHDEVVSRHRVVIGKEETPTPVFSHVMQFLIINPYWNVPASILKKEMLPKLAADPRYLHRLGYEVFKKDGRLIVRQPPGERNALGRIKFMFPNDYAVYLHDTPAKHYFDEDKRTFSHGCVRVDEPYQFAETLLGPKWNEDRIKSLFGGKERYINLPKPLPIHLEYFTASVDRFGHLQLREDIYGYTRKLITALGLQE